MSDRLFYVLLPRFNMFSLTNLMEPARIANYLSVEDVYHKKYLSFDGPDITASNGRNITLTGNYSLGYVCRPETVCGSARLKWVPMFWRAPGF